MQTIKEQIVNSLVFLLILNNINMNFDRFDNQNFSVAGFTASEIYPYFAQKTKRIFRGFRYEIGNTPYRIITYPHSLVQVEPLIAHLKLCKQKQHKMLGNIKYIFQEASLSNINDKANMQKVIAVVLEDQKSSDLVSIYQLLTETNNFSQKLTKQLIYQLVTFLIQMSVQGIDGYFNVYDVFIDLSTGLFRIDSYGDRQFYRVKENSISNCWEIGSLYYTCIRGIPPYNSQSPNDAFYSALKQNNFNKFWAICRQKPQNHIEEFINLCFTQQTKIEDLEHCPYLLNYEKISEEQKLQEIKVLKEEKQKKEAAAISKRISRKQKIQKCMQHRNSIQGYRNGTVIERNVQMFIEMLEKEQNNPRLLPVCQSHQEKQEQAIDEHIQNYQIAYLLSLLRSEEQINIFDFTDDKTHFQFRIAATLGDNLSINSKVRLDLAMGKKGVSYQIIQIEGSFFECMWVRAKLTNLLQEV